ncbi:MAG: lactonase family protein, partial [Planctomycetota bacterium]|nr:lactonase family protein [Planctomycetota bacterium]
DRTGRHLLAVNYGTGSVMARAIGEDGRLGEATAFIAHRGHSVHPKRQTGPHAHSVHLDAANRFAFVADLGLDKVMVYRFDAGAGTLAPHDPPSVAVAPGSGPRHFAFHPSGRFAYVVNELTSTVTAFRYDAASGVLAPLDTAGTLPKGFAGSNTGAEVAVHPSGRFLYTSNRGHDSIAIFAIDAGTGRLRPVGHAPTRGKRPRHFAVDPSGRFLLAANRDSNNVVVFRIDGESGRLDPTGGVAEVPGPVCILMVPRR